VSKTPTDPGDWSSASEALFRASRGDHAPSERDRERVRNALARKLAESSHAPATSPAANVEFTTKSGAAVGKLVKLGVGAASVMAAGFAFMLASPRSDLAQSSAQHSTAPSGPAPDIALPSSDEPKAAVLASADGPPRPRAARPARERRMFANARSLMVAKPMAAAPAPSASTMLANASPTVSASESSAARPSAPEPARTQSRPAAAAAAAASPAASSGDEDEDARAELAFVRQIHEAMLETKPRAVLALCAEHERRWPRGTFVQEREGLRAMAWCQSGVREAGARARTFFARYPLGPIAPRVREACASQLEAGEEFPGR
jgi:hypothetical protein